MGVCVGEFVVGERSANLVGSRKCFGSKRKIAVQLERASLGDADGLYNYKYSMKHHWTSNTCHLLVKESYIK